MPLSNFANSRKSENSRMEPRAALYNTWHWLTLSYTAVFEASGGQIHSVPAGRSLNMRPVRRVHRGSSCRPQKHGSCRRFNEAMGLRATLALFRRMSLKCDPSHSKSLSIRHNTRQGTYRFGKPSKRARMTSHICDPASRKWLTMRIALSAIVQMQQKNL